MKRRITLPCDKDTVQELSVGSEVEVTLKGTVKEVREEELPAFDDEETNETIREVGIEATSVKATKSDNEFMEMADEESD